MKIFLRITFVILGLFFFSLIGQAQFISKNIVVGDTTQVHVLKTENGDRFVGRVIRIENTTIYFLFLKKNTLEFNLTEVSSIALLNERTSNGTGRASNEYRRAREIYDKRNSLPNVLTGEENLFFAPSAFTYGKKKGEYRTTMVFYNRLDYGLTENIDIGLDLMPLIGFNLIALRGKVGLPLAKNIIVGFGSSLYVTIIPFTFNDDVTRGATHTYGVATIGNRERFINFSYGYALPFNPQEEDGATTLNIGGSMRIGERWKLMVDLNFIGSVNDPEFYTFGASWFNRRNRFDFGISTLNINTNNNFRNSRTLLPLPFATYALSF